MNPFGPNIKIPFPSRVQMICESAISLKEELAKVSSFLEEHLRAHHVRENEYIAQMVVELMAKFPQLAIDAATRIVIKNADYMGQHLGGALERAYNEFANKHVEKLQAEGKLCPDCGGEHVKCDKDDEEPPDLQ